MLGKDFDIPMITPDDVVMMHDILIEWCEQNHVDPNSNAGQDQARSIIAWFQSGFCTPGVLRNIVMPPRAATRH